MYYAQKHGVPKSRHQAIRVLVLVLTVSQIIILKDKVITELHTPIDSQKYNLLVLSTHNV